MKLSEFFKKVKLADNNKEALDKMKRQYKALQKLAEDMNIRVKSS
jgi:hypothetical protein